METALEVQRSPELIAAEINNIKNQTRTMLLYNSIEIGRRLTEAKLCLPHGEWGKWLEESVDYSKSTANNLMRIFDEYGSDQLALFGATGAKSQALGSLTYSQAVALLAIPGDEREEFIQENDALEMSTRELKQAIRDRDQAREAKENVENAMKSLQERIELERVSSKLLSEEIARLSESLKEAQAKGDDKEANDLREDLEQADQLLEAANEEIAELKKQLTEKPVDVPATVEVIPPEVEAELADLRKKSLDTAELQFKMQFKTLTNTFNELLQTLDEVDSESRAKYQSAIKTLIDKMLEFL